MKAKTLQQFVDGLNAYLKTHPDHADKIVVTARDDEGNGYNRVFYDPTLGRWDVGSEEVKGVCVS